jgi:hypothetical protein
LFVHLSFRLHLPVKHSFFSFSQKQLNLFSISRDEGLNETTKDIKLIMVESGRPGVLMYAGKPSNWKVEAEAGRHEFEASLDHTVTPCL